MIYAGKHPLVTSSHIPERVLSNVCRYPMNFAWGYMRLLTTKPTLAWVYYGFVSTKPTHGRGYTVHVVFVNIMKKQARYNMNIPYTRNTNKYEHNIYIPMYILYRMRVCQKQRGNWRSVETLAVWTVPPKKTKRVALDLEFRFTIFQGNIGECNDNKETKSTNMLQTFNS